MSTTVDRPRDVREALLREAVALVSSAGPERVSLREVQRRVGVSAAAAYKHYRDRDALLVAVGRRASAYLADAISGAMTGAEDPRSELRAGCRAYIEYALTQPGLFRSVLLTGESIEQIAHPSVESVGRSALGPYEILQQVLRRHTGHAEDAPSVWASCHGLAVLLLDSPLQHLGADAKNVLIARHLDLVDAGLTRLDTGR